MATDLYVDGQRFRVIETDVSQHLLAELSGKLGEIPPRETYEFEVADANGNTGALRLVPARVGSVAIIKVP
jgi:hypothetical protein